MLLRLDGVEKFFQAQEQRGVDHCEFHWHTLRAETLREHEGWHFIPSCLVKVGPTILFASNGNNCPAARAGLWQRRPVRL